MLRLFYYKIKVEGLENVPRNTPLIVTPNHQNALLDPLLVGSFIQIPLHYLTRSDVFTSWTKPILKLFNMLPIYRIRDGYAKLSLNDGIFGSCQEIFRQKGSVLIFAEGNHGKEYYLRPLTKGAARLALQSQKQLDEELMVLPVGLNFWSHREPKSTVLIKFGKPFSVKNYLDQYERNSTKGLIEMRDAISDGMKETLIIQDETDDYELRKRFTFQQKHEAFTFQDLKSIELSDEDVDVKPSKGHWIAKFLNPIPFLLIRHFIQKVDDVVFHATLKFTIGLIAFPIWWVSVFLILFFTLGIKIAVLAVIVMVFGLFYSYQR
ncbi:1-acyl-sn-glycerol-3-phosphate acyltransferase [Ekhidna sp.]|uniref:1-acyl-sn-glycerol-3-phosphate acyltransferase n=1 Tax=Ekhidna sp. TaxID=2608089 RepID=UPI003BAC506D